MENYLGKNVGKLGFGLMRLPEKNGETDIEQVKTMVDMYMAAGFNYFDTAFVYGNGASERAARLALVDRYPRESFLLATKMPLFDAADRQEIYQRFYTSLERTGAGYFDYYLIHSMGPGRWEAAEETDMWNWLSERKKEGLIKHLGFSMHDSAEALDRALTAHPETEFVQLQINYLDWEDEKIQSRACYEVAMKHGVPVIIMEPVKGGMLSSLPLEAEALMKQYAPGRSISSWAVRYCASLPGVITVLSGMSNIEQMQDNLSYMAEFEPLSDGEREVIGKCREIIDKVEVIACTKCKYCLAGCPRKINIPGVFECANIKTIFRNEAKAKAEYGWVKEDENGDPGDCIGCGACEDICPQHLPIINLLKEAAEWIV